MSHTNRTIDMSTIGAESSRAESYVHHPTVLRVRGILTSSLHPLGRFEQKCIMLEFLQHLYLSTLYIIAITTYCIAPLISPSVKDYFEAHDLGHPASRRLLLTSISPRPPKSYTAPNVEVPIRTMMSRLILLPGLSIPVPAAQDGEDDGDDEITPSIAEK